MSFVRLDETGSFVRAAERMGGEYSLKRRQLLSKLGLDLAVSERSKSDNFFANKCFNNGSEVIFRIEI
jgi:hypothetical protein